MSLHCDPLSRRLTRPLRMAILGSALMLPLSAQAKTITAVMHSGLRVLDPVLTTADISQYHGYMIYDVLMSVDENFVARPQMADWKISDDKLTYTFTLRPGLKWHDGTPVTGEDCVASLKRWAKRDSMGQLLMGVTDSLEATGETGFVWKLKEPADFLVEALSKPSTIVPFMMPKRIAETSADESIKEYVGSGPFKFVPEEFKPGVKVVYVKNNDYAPRAEPANWASGGKVVKVDRVEWITMPDHQTAANALLAGEIDYFEAVPMDLAPLVEDDDNIVTGVTNKLGWQFAGRMNFLHPPFNDQKLRRAALLAMSQKPVLEATIGDPKYYRTCGAMFGCGTPLETDVGSESLVKGNGLEQAKQLVKEANYDGSPVVILQPTDLHLLKPQPLIAAQALREVGFNVQLQPMDWQTLVSRRASQKPVSEGGWSMFFTGWVTTSMMNPLLNMALNGRGTQGGWFGWPEDPEIEKMREAFSRAPTPDARKKIAEQIQAHAYEQAMYIPLGQYETINAWRKNITGVLAGPTPYFWGMDKADSR